MLYHTPVLLSESQEVLDLRPGMVLVDGTLGNGGHTIEFLKQGVSVYGIDQDQTNLRLASDRINQLNLAANFHPVHANFSEISQVVSDLGLSVDRLFFDLGLSQNQLLAQDRGFSFNDPLSLDMRLDPQVQDLTAENIINTYSFDQLYEIFTKYAQEKYSKPLILRLIRERQKSPIKNAKRLADIVSEYYLNQRIKTSIHPATKILMALRIAVNDEYGHLKSVLDQTLTVLKPSGRAAFITFHSGEDRLVKQFIQKKAHLGQITPVNPKAIAPTFAEIKANPLARSALLRAYRLN